MDKVSDLCLIQTANPSVGLYDFLDRILKEQELRDQERTRIQEMKENINKK